MSAKLLCLGQSSLLREESEDGRMVNKAEEAWKQAVLEVRT